ncbi:Metallo-beta-lactamase protein [Favolaschia claudopus]|uniref:Metallo-beta-lactamase protein n=1 Tax=Favolaschia claudopus TaxID=2862362 RepID=A0AAW0B9B3_9AGAR
MYPSQWMPAPYAPRIPNISLPATSPRAASAAPGLRAFFSPPRQGNSSRPSQPQNVYQPVPTYVYGRNYEQPAPPTMQSHPAPSVAGYQPSGRYESRGHVATEFSEFPGVAASNRSAASSSSRPAASSLTRTGASASNRPPAAEARAPPKSILKTSRTRGNSVSSNPEQSRPAPVAGRVRSPPPLNVDPSELNISLHRIKPLKPEAISLRWLLVKYTSSPKRSRDPLLYFDIGFDPKNRDNLKNRRRPGVGMTPVSEEDRILSASTHCSITEMNIVCPKLGVITVSRRDGIRCIDVFDAIYQAYNKPIWPNEQPGPDEMGRYMRHFKARCDACPNPSHEFWVGMRRVDLLRGRRIFDGLTRLGSDWELKLD